MFGFGKALIASLLASGALALPKAQTNTNGNTDPNNMKSPTTGQTTEQIKSQGVPGKIGENPPLPPVSDVGPAYSLLLAKEISPTDLDGVIVVWAYGLPFCTQRQLLSESIEDFCYRNLTFDRVPKLDENLQATGEVTQISGYFAGCSDDVSLGRSYAGLYWVELIGMHDGIGDQPASDGGSSTTQSTTNPPPSTQQNSGTGTGTTTTSNGNGQGQGGVRGSTEGEGEGTAYKCNNDREAHGCPRSPTTEVDIVTFASCGQYAYTDKKGEPGTGGTTTTSTQNTNQQQGGGGGSGGGSGMGGKKYKTLKAIKV
ncbi:hypothetical protein IWZ01DRAFT_95059 [Phyllosticta capitalensis]